ncbi:UNVERIFIED_ORG: superfamily II DNA or RNA helicase [Methylorubrum zatmanii]
MIEDLIEKVWSNPRFHQIAEKLELAWLSKELSIEGHTFEDLRSALKISQAAAILACSPSNDHKQSAFRVATQAFELFGDDTFPHSSILRITLARIGNLPSIQTRSQVANSLPMLPWRIAAEELHTVDKQSITIGDRDLQLTGFQHNLWSRLSNGERIALSAPTSAGKSFVLQAYIRAVFERSPRANILYLVPTRALISQVSQDFIESTSTWGTTAPQVITAPFDTETKLPESALYIFTQERAQIMLQSHEFFAPQIIIVDEAHSIAEGSRGVLLQSVLDEILVRSPKAQALFASPTIRNLEVFGKLFGLTDVFSFKSTEPTVSQNFINVKIEAAKKGIIVFSSFGDGQRTIVEVGRKTVGQTLANRKDKLLHIPLLMEGSGASIVYANGAAEAEDVAIQLSENRREHESTERRQALAKLAAEVVHSSYVLSECVNKGVGFHYSNIPTILRLEIERAFKEGHIDYLASTSTLLQGVNLPAKHIFMCKPEKGRGKPIESTDFWNLAGRAGRLMREFQGNIFLIDYENWIKKPLSGPKDDVVEPAIGHTISQYPDQFIRTVQDRSGSLREKNQDVLDSSFVKLFSDFRSGRITEAFARAGISDGSDRSENILTAFDSIRSTITLPDAVLKRSSNISPHKQETLYRHFKERLANEGRDAAVGFLPAHPREENAFKSYEKILYLCYTMLLIKPPTDLTHRFHALLALRWMLGWPLPRIIQTQIDRNPGKSTRKIIRDTLNVIETEVRFQSVRMFTCYNSILVYALDEFGYVDLASAVPGIPLYLEVGASDQTMISFVGLGLSRAVATRLNDLAGDKNLSPAKAIEWLAGRSIDSLGLSPLLAEEVRNILKISA